MENQRLSHWVFISVVSMIFCLVIYSLTGFITFPAFYLLIQDYTPPQFSRMFFIWRGMVNLDITFLKNDLPSLTLSPKFLLNHCFIYNHNTPTHFSLFSYGRGSTHAHNKKMLDTSAQHWRPLFPLNICVHHKNNVFHLKNVYKTLKEKFAFFAH